MEFKKLLEELKKLNLPLGHYAIFGSGPLAVRNLRESSDLDIVVSNEVWQKFVSKYPTKENNSSIIQLGNIEICKDILPWLENVEEKIEHADMIDGFCFFTLQDTIELKERFGREKDKKDIERIKNFLNKKD